MDQPTPLNPIPIPGREPDPDPAPIPDRLVSGPTSVSVPPAGSSDPAESAPDRSVSVGVSGDLRHPNQPIHLDARGILRFKQNEIVRYLLDAGPFDMNQLAALPFSEDDWNQFAQLLGYSVDGFAELSYADPARVAWADRQGSVL